MKISAQEEYGLRCLLRLLKQPSQSATLPEIAAAEGLSIAYVAKFMSVLRNAGIIESVRGRSGGYRMAKSPDEVGLGFLLLVLGEPLYEETEYCQRHAGVSPDGICVNNSSCSLRTLWQTLESWIRRSLDQISLADLVAHESHIGDFLKERLAIVAREDANDMIPLTVVSN